MNIDTLTVHCFLAVAETGSFTKAGDRVGRTQSAVSQQIAKLEHSLDTSLFVRGKILQLTAAGEIFLSYAQQIFTLHREAIDRFKQPELQGDVRFGLPEDFASVFLSDVLADFAHTHPRIFLNIECDLTLNLLGRFKKNEFDLVLVKMHRPDDFPHGVEIWQEDLQWVSNGMILDYDQPIPLVMSPTPCVYRNSAMLALEEAGIKWRLAFSSPSYSSTIAAVKAGMGITVFPRQMIPDWLMPIDPSFLPKLSNIHVSLLKARIDNPAVNSLAEFVIKKLK
jgi:DNA-binding transcriptional LysR family regulator